MKIMPEFHETMLGKKFFRSDLPRIIEALEKIAKELKRTNDQIDEDHPTH